MHSIMVESISPRDAEKYLATMVKNRPVSEAKVLEYALEMEGGRWSLNGETLKFDSHGHLFDGQHRLRACVLAEKSFRSYVVRGIEDEKAFATVDVGKSRGHGDIFGIAGFAHPKEASTAAMLIYLIKGGKVGWRGPEGRRANRLAAEGALGKKKMGVMPHNTTVVPKDVLLKFALPIADGLDSSVRAVKALSNRGVTKFMGAGMAAGLYYLMREKSFDDAELFFNNLGEGAGLSKTDPVYHLRERLLDKGHSRLNRWTIAGLCIKAWNKRRVGEEMRYLKIGDGEEFPKKLK